MKLSDDKDKKDKKYQVTNIERYHWRHFFGGVALVFLVLQFLSGIFLIYFYSPHLNEAYASVQYLYKTMTNGAWFRDMHRWIALALFLALVVHMTRSILRKEFLTYKLKTVWLTGVLFLLPFLAFLVTGFILPWEWKGYWFMEVVPNYFGNIPIIGASLQETLISIFTLNRAFVVHILVLPVISLILIDLHVLDRLRKRRHGISGYLIKHALLSLPFFVVVTLLAVYLPMPTEDPEIIPMPLEGANIPTPEWPILFFFVPFMHFKGFVAPFLGLYLPLLLFVILAGLPYYFKNTARRQKLSSLFNFHIANKVGHFFAKALKDRFATKAGSFAVVTLVVIMLLTPFYASTYKSPSLGCNSCHNISMGTRMGIPPKHYKDRNILPLLADNEWMVKHWFYPTVTW